MKSITYHLNIYKIKPGNARIFQKISGYIQYQNWARIPGIKPESIVIWRYFYSTSNIVHWENYISIPFHSEWDMIVVTVFEPNENSIWSKNRQHDYIPFTVKGNGNIVFSVCIASTVVVTLLFTFFFSLYFISTLFTLFCFRFRRKKERK